MAGSEGRDPRSDLVLIAAINQGDFAAFEVLYHRYRDWVTRLAFRFTGNREDALDVLQETFTYLVGKFPGFELRARLTTFLYPAVKHLSLEIRRRARRWGQSPVPDLPAPVGGEDSNPEEMPQLLAGLPEPQMEVVLMRFVDDLGLEEIGAALGVPTGTVKSRLHHALRKLRDDPRTRRYFES